MESIWTKLVKLLWLIVSVSSMVGANRKKSRKLNNEKFILRILYQWHCIMSFIFQFIFLNNYIHILMTFNFVVILWWGCKLNAWIWSFFYLILKRYWIIKKCIIAHCTIHVVFWHIQFLSYKTYNSKSKGVYLRLYLLIFFISSSKER